MKVYIVFVSKEYDYVSVIAVYLHKEMAELRVKIQEAETTQDDISYVVEEWEVFEWLKRKS